MPLLYGVLSLGAALQVGLISSRTLLGIISFVVVAVGLLVYYQESVLYIPVIQGWKTPADNPSGYQSPSQQRLHFEDVYFQSADGTQLHGWFLPAPSSVLEAEAQVPTILFCHENAGNIGLRIPEFQNVHQKLRVNQFVFDYRGYGHSKGTPSEAGLVADALAAYEWVVSKGRLGGSFYGVHASKVVVVGRSLGGAVAVGLLAKLTLQSDAEEERRGNGLPAALIIENSFTSISDMVDAKFPILNVPFFKEFFLRLKWDSETAIKTLPPKLPILFLSSSRDEIVPATQMHALKQAAAASSEASAAARAERTLVSFDATHNDIWMAGGHAYWAAKKSFLSRNVPSG